MKADRKNGGIQPLILKLAINGSKWLTSRPGTFPLNRRSGGPQRRCGRFGDEKSLVAVGIVRYVAFPLFPVFVRVYITMAQRLRALY
jgi:hypothetical protein